MSESKHPTGSAAKFWDREAASYDGIRQDDPVYSSCIVQAARAIPRGTKKCLDAGCGTGMSTEALCTRCKQVVAIDYSKESLKVLERKGLQNVVTLQADISSLPFPDNSFDACLCANTLQHFRADGPQVRAISEIRRVTKEGGIISLSVHHYSKIKQIAGWKKEGKPGQAGIDYIYRYTLEDLRKLLPQSVITGIGYYGLLRIPFFGARLQNVLARMLGRSAGIRGYGHMLLAVMRNNESTSDNPELSRRPDTTDPRCVTGD